MSCERPAGFCRRPLTSVRCLEGEPESELQHARLVRDVVVLRLLTEQRAQGFNRCVRAIVGVVEEIEDLEHAVNGNVTDQPNVLLRANVDAMNGLSHEGITRDKCTVGTQPAYAGRADGPKVAAIGSGIAQA